MGTVDELVTSNGILLDPIQLFSRNALEDEIQNWGQGLANSEQLFTDHPGAAPPASAVSTLASGSTTLLHEKSSLEKADKAENIQDEDECFQRSKES